MTDQHYFDCFNDLAKGLSDTGSIDDGLFYAIFEGKIKPIIRNVYSELFGRYSSIDFEDLCQDIFLKIWTRCVGAYFLNENYEKNAAMFLGWCKVVVKNHVTSLIRKKSVRDHETLDDPDHPVTVTDGKDPSGDLAETDTVKTVILTVLGLSATAEMKLTWLGVYLPIYSGDADGRIDATHLFCDRFSNKTFGDVFEYAKSILDSSAKLGVGGAYLKDLESDVKNGSLSDRVVGESLGDDPLGKVSDRLYKVNKKLSAKLPTEVL